MEQSEEYKYANFEAASYDAYTSVYSVRFILWAVKTARLRQLRMMRTKEGDGDMEQSAEYVYGNLEAPAEDDDTFDHSVLQYIAKDEVHVPWV